ncbi:MAG: hypothetical protein LC624_06970 [Halobacteriales archaeon]|nr:hypothetical protein [Halobacteriales archaeon]
MVMALMAAGQAEALVTAPPASSVTSGHLTDLASAGSTAINETRTDVHRLSASGEQTNHAAEGEIEGTWQSVFEGAGAPVNDLFGECCPSSSTVWVTMPVPFIILDGGLHAEDTALDIASDEAEKRMGSVAAFGDEELAILSQ